MEVLGFEVAMDLGWVVTLASPTNSSAQVTVVSNEDPAAPGLEIVYPLRDEEWGVRRFMLRELSGTIVNVVSHRSA